MERMVKILWSICCALFCLGIFLSWVEVKKYDTDTYWVAQNHEHVYEQYSGEIVDVIENDETCKVKEDVILVKKKVHGRAWFTVGVVLMLMTGAIIAMKVFEVVKETWEDTRK